MTPIERSAAAIAEAQREQYYMLTHRRVAALAFESIDPGDLAKAIHDQRGGYWYEAYETADTIRKFLLTEETP